jgi:FMN phosphatase YigB (HAD superfamily)
MEKLILVDCDGVLLRWEEAFDAFMITKGHTRLLNTANEYNLALRYGVTRVQTTEYVKEFNEGPLIEKLEPFQDSVEYVTKLAALGFRFIAVTSVSDHPAAKKYRTINLTNLFGDVFDDIICLEMNASKATVLLQWANTGYFWIEDHMQQAEAGHEAGLQTILINHPYNKHYKTDLFPTVSYETPWKDIFTIVLDAYYGPMP